MNQENKEQQESISVGEKQKYVEISWLQIFNEQGIETKNLIHGEKFSINVHYNILEEVDDLVFEIIIFNQQKRAIFSTSTYSEKIKTERISKGRLTITYQIMNYLSSGKYYISAKVNDETRRIYYDWKDDMFTFWVSNQHRLISFGGVDLPHEIRLLKD